MTPVCTYAIRYSGWRYPGRRSCIYGSAAAREVDYSRIASFDYNANFIQPLGVVQAGTASASWSRRQYGRQQPLFHCFGWNHSPFIRNLFYRFKVLPALRSTIRCLSNIQATLNEGNPNSCLTMARYDRCIACGHGKSFGQCHLCANQPTQLAGSRVPPTNTNGRATIRLWLKPLVYSFVERQLYPTCFAQQQLFCSERYRTCDHQLVAHRPNHPICRYLARLLWRYCISCALSRAIPCSGSAMATPSLAH